MIAIGTAAERDAAVFVDHLLARLAEDGAPDVSSAAVRVVTELRQCWRSSDDPGDVERILGHALTIGVDHDGVDQLVGDLVLLLGAAVVRLAEHRRKCRNPNNFKETPEP